ncbi:MAG: DUF3566 domain-containing protein [Nanoarchaeota archaeon]|nr:DUF3566 domain-containing protein [Nanoarchaeota archaeon]
MATKKEAKGMSEFKKFGVLSVGKVLAIFGIILGLVYGVLMGVTSTKLTPALIGTDPQLQFVSMLGWAAIIVMPIIMAAIYFVIGVLSAFIYNLIASRFGGIKIQLK